AEQGRRGAPRARRRHDGHRSEPRPRARDARRLQARRRQPPQGARPMTREQRDQAATMLRCAADRQLVENESALVAASLAVAASSSPAPGPRDQLALGGAVDAPTTSGFVHVTERPTPVDGAVETSWIPTVPPPPEEEAPPEGEPTQQPPTGHAPPPKAGT